MSTVLLEHRRSTKTEGWRTLIGGVLTCAGLIGFIHLYSCYLDHIPLFWMAIWHVLALTFFGLLIFCYAIPNIMLDREFSFSMTADRIECRSPADTFGESYSISINEIVALEEESTEGSSHWFMLVSDGRRICITPNYKNPVHGIINTIRDLRPKLPEKTV